MTNVQTLAAYVDFVLMAIATEAIGLGIYNRLTGRGLVLIDLIANLASGAALVLALRLTIAEAPMVAVLASLLASLAAHVLDLKRRWRS